jgi:catechol 2,3-dioxygenase-like lactoylglutathione lyase family enzyme
MTPAFIEHVNITVSDIARTAQILEALFGWRERWRGESAQGGLTIHVGGEASYVALHTKDPTGGPLGHAKGRPLNHIGVVVDDLDAAEARAKALGLVAFSHGDYAPGRRFYLFDPDGVEFEIVSYAGAKGDGA